MLVRFVPSRTQEVAPQGRVVGVSVSGELDEKLGDARRGRCLAEPGAVAPLAVVFRVHPAFSKSFVAFKELVVCQGRRTCQPKVFRV